MTEPTREELVEKVRDWVFSEMYPDTRRLPAKCVTALLLGYDERGERIAELEAENTHDNAQALRVWLRALELIGDKAEGAITYTGGTVDAAIEIMGAVEQREILLAYCDYKPVTQLAEVLTRTAVMAVRAWRKQQETK